MTKMDLMKHIHLQKSFEKKLEEVAMAELQK